MKAEKDDMPEHLRHRRSTGPWRMIAILGIGSAITWTLIALFAKPIVIDVAQLKSAIRFNDRRVFDAASEAHRQSITTNIVAHPIATPAAYTYSNAPKEPPVSWSQQAQTVKLDNGEKQTVYNDSNYIRPKNINTIKPLPNNQLYSNQKSKKAFTATVVGVDDKRKDLCDYHKPGSIERRNCRQYVDLSSRNRN